MSLLEVYVVVSSKHYLDEKWDCTTLSLNYNCPKGYLYGDKIILCSKKY